LVENSGLALAAIFLGTLALGWRKERIDQPALVALGLATASAYMLFQSRRFVEYFPPFALIFLALCATPLLSDWLAELRQRRPAALPFLPLVVSLALIYPLYVTVRDARALVNDAKPADYFADAALWLQENTPPGAMIFQTDWDDFTRLFFYHDDARYTAGLDPTFLQLREPELYEEWVEITQGRVELPSTVIRERFAAGYVFSDLNHEAFLEMAAGDPGLKELYRDGDAVIFAVQP
jgi:asparagine N-glycosylation enzyme membrane subunit Stt3